MANKKFENALNRVSQKTPPIWFMRQAGRYHKHYQNLRSKNSFMDLCKKPELASEVALGPIMDFDFDVSIMFSDLLFPLEALGMGLQYTDKGPKLAWSLNRDNLNQLLNVDKALEGLQFQKDVLELTRSKLPSDKSLIGFVGGPWTLFVYACEGSHSGSLIASKTQLDVFAIFCEILVPLLVENIRLQLDGGAEVVMIFDTAAGELSPEIYEQWVVPQLCKIASHFPRQVAYYSKGTTPYHFGGIHNSGAISTVAWAGFGFDHRFDLADILKNTHSGFNSGFVQGNFDQALLFLPPEKFEFQLKKYLEKFECLSIDERAGWVCGLGHGILPATPEENVRNFVRIVREQL